MRGYMKDQTGEIRKITMMEFRSNPGKVIDAVETGKAFVICRNGKEMAVIQNPANSGLVAHVSSRGKITYCPVSRE